MKVALLSESIYISKLCHILNNTGGGLGIKSIRAAVDEQRVKLDLQALNDEDYTTNGTGVSMLAKVVRLKCTS